MKKNFTIRVLCPFRYLDTTKNKPLLKRILERFRGISKKRPTISLFILYNSIPHRYRRGKDRGKDRGRGRNKDRGTEAAEAAAE
jgi:hypothetical protein